MYGFGPDSSALLPPGAILFSGATVAGCRLGARGIRNFQHAICNGAARRSSRVPASAARRSSRPAAVTRCFQSVQIGPANHASVVRGASPSDGQFAKHSSNRTRVEPLQPQCLGGRRGLLKSAARPRFRRRSCPWHVRCLEDTLMTIVALNSFSQEFDDSRFFQRLTLIDICCGPPRAL